MTSPAMLPSPLASHSLLAPLFLPAPPSPSATGREEKKKEKKRARERRERGSGPGAQAGRQTRSAAGASGSPGGCQGPSGLWDMYVRSATCEPVGAGAGRHALLLRCPGWQPPCPSAEAPGTQPPAAGSQPGDDGQLTAHPRPPLRARTARPRAAPAPRVARATLSIPAAPPALLPSR